MKHLFYLCSLLLGFTLLLPACGSDDDGGGVTGEYFMNFKANGTEINFTNQFILQELSSQNEEQYFSTITGANDATSNLGIQIYEDEPLAERTYTGYDFVGSLVIGVIISYRDPATGLNYGSGGGPGTDAEVTITEITDSSVRGTFRGTLTHAGQPDIAISEGVFYVRRG